MAWNACPKVPHSWTINFVLTLSIFGQMGNPSIWYLMPFQAFIISYLILGETCKAAWRLHAAWSKAEIPLRAHPISSQVVKGLAGKAWSERNYVLSVCLLLAHNALLRTGELLRLRVSDLTWGRRVVHLAIRDAKSGATHWGARGSSSF